MFTCILMKLGFTILLFPFNKYKFIYIHIILAHNGKTNEWKMKGREKEKERKRHFIYFARLQFVHRVCELHGADR